MIRCETPDQVQAVIPEMAKAGSAFTFIGSGSNLLISDDGVPAVVIRYASHTPSISRNKETLIVSGGTELDALVRYTVESGIGGFVNCSGIPGTVGGAIAGNAGAFGWQIADALESIHAIDRYGNQKNLTPEDIGFSYRHSGLRGRREYVLEACFRISPAESQELMAQRYQILELRAAKHPDISVDACAGSFFKNIEPTSAAARRQAAGWYLERAGTKDMRVGGAGVFEKHANIIIQRDKSCTAQHVFELSCMMAEAVKKRFGITLTREVQLLGKFENMGGGFRHHL